MTEWSTPFTNGLTDGGPVSAASMWRVFRMLLGPAAEEADKGVVRSWNNELAATSPGADQVAIDTGAAFCQGTPYENTASLTLTASRPSSGTTGKRVVLRKDIVNGGVRATVISSADGTAALPALTQSESTYWDIPICSFTHATNGAIAALTDEREFLVIGGGGEMETVGPFEWATRLAMHYSCEFTFTNLFNNAIPGSYLGTYGWQIGVGTSDFGGPTTVASTGDANSQADDDPPHAVAASAAGVYLWSPPVIGGWGAIKAREKRYGVTITRIRTRMTVRFSGTSAVDNDGVAIVSGVAANSIWASGSLAVVVGATYFEYRVDGAAGVSTGIAKDSTLWHEVDFIYNVQTGLTSIEIDQVQVASGLSLATDNWPKRAGFAAVTGTNDPRVARIAIDYLTD